MESLDETRPAARVLRVALVAVIMQRRPDVARHECLEPSVVFLRLGQRPKVRRQRRIDGAEIVPALVAVSVRHDAAAGGHLVVLDAGTGIRLLGQDLADRGNGPLQVDLLLTHTHWDHIQGIPFFQPLVSEGNAVRVWGSKQGDTDLDVILRQQMHPVVFPVPLDRMAATLTVEHVDPGGFEIDGCIPNGE